MIINTYSTILILFKKIFLIPLCMFVLSMSVVYLSNRNGGQYNFLFYFGMIFFYLSPVFLFYNLCMFLCNKYQKKFQHINNPLFFTLFSMAKKGLKVILGLTSACIIISFIPFPAFHLAILYKIIYGFLIGYAGWSIIQILSAVEEYYKYLTLISSDKKKDMRIFYTKIQIIKNIFVIIVIFLSIAGMLLLFDEVRTVGISLLASAGFITAIVGLAAQKTLASLFEGFQLATSHPIRIDDAIVVENEFGTIEEIKLSYVVVKLWDLRRLIVPISYFLDKPFQNWSYLNDYLIGTIFLYVDFSLPVEPLREEFYKILNESPLWDKKVARFDLNEFKETAIELRALVSSENPADLYELRANVREHLLTFIQKKYSEHFPKSRINITPQKLVDL